MTYYWQLTWSRSKRHCGPFQDQEGMLSLRSCRVDSGRMLLFTVERVFLPVGGFDWCLMQVHGASKGVRGGGRPETFLMLKLFLSYHTMWILYYQSREQNFTPQWIAIFSYPLWVFLCGPLLNAFVFICFTWRQIRESSLCTMISYSTQQSLLNTRFPLPQDVDPCLICLHLPLNL